MGSFRGTHLLHKEDIMSYDDKAIKALTDCEHVQLRPSMYISSEHPHLQMFTEILDNSVDEALNGYATKIRVDINYDDNSVRIRDNGRGLPQGINEQLSIPTIQVIYGKLNAGGKYTSDSYQVSGGLHGVGSSVVNFLSERFYVFSWRNQNDICAYYENGILKNTEPQNPEDELCHMFSTSGTSVSFKIGTNDIFKGMNLLDFQKDIVNKILVCATLLPNCEFYYQGTLVEAGNPVTFLPEIENHTTPLVVDYKSRNVRYLAVMFWDKDSNKTSYDSYANMVHTFNGGDHLKGLEDILIKLHGNSDILWGINVFVSCNFPRISYDGQSKSKAISKELREYILTNITNIVKTSNEFTEASKLATSKRTSLSAKRITRTSNRSYYLAMLETGFQDASSRDRSLCSLFLTEGKSAGGGLVQTRNPKTMAVMPLRGKTINAYINTMKDVLANKEIQTIINAISCGILDNCDPSKSRYSEIVITTDADSDGQQIACLLLTFFCKYMRPLVEAGKLFIANPPLYSVFIKGKKFFFSDENTMRMYSEQGIQVSRNKGLGEMLPSDLFTSTINPDTREPYYRVTLDDISSIENIMGTDSKYRRLALEERGVLF